MKITNHTYARNSLTSFKRQAQANDRKRKLYESTAYLWPPYSSTPKEIGSLVFSRQNRPLLMFRFILRAKNYV